MYLDTVVYCGFCGKLLVSSLYLSDLLILTAVTDVVVGG